MFRTRCCSGWWRLARPWGMAGREMAATENVQEAPARISPARKVQVNQICLRAHPGLPIFLQERMVGAEQLK